MAADSQSLVIYISSILYLYYRSSKHFLFAAFFQYPLRLLSISLILDKMAISVSSFASLL
jgi:hypothetical protein